MYSSEMWLLIIFTVLKGKNYLHNIYSPTNSDLIKRLKDY